jgi:hypothetical protein
MTPAGPPPAMQQVTREDEAAMVNLYALRAGVRSIFCADAGEEN